MPVPPPLQRDFDEMATDRAGFARAMAAKFAARTRGRDGHWDEWLGQAFIDLAQIAANYRGDSLRGYAATYLPKKLIWRRHREYGGRWIDNQWKYVNSAGYDGKAATRRVEPTRTRDGRLDAAIAAMTTLTDIQWTVWAMSARGLTEAQITAATGLSAHTIGKAKAEGLAAMRKALGVGTPKSHVPKSGIPGVVFDSFTGQWRGALRYKGKQYYTRRYDSVDEAAGAFRDLRAVVVGLDAA